MPNIDFYYDTADNTLETIVDGGLILTQAQATNITFRFFFKDYDNNIPFTNGDIASNQCLINIERPNGSSSNNIIASPDTINTCYKLDILDWVTGVAGTLKVTAKLFNATNNTTTTYGLATLQILPSAVISLDTIEDQQYQAIINALNELQNLSFIVRATEAITKGDLVVYAGTLGASGKILVAKARISGTPNINTNPEIIFGVAKDTIANNAEGRVMTSGIITGINTNAYTEGAILYPNINVAGGLTNTPAAAPNNRMPIAVTIYKHENNGILLVRPTFMPNMKQIKDVDTTNIALYGSNSMLKYNSGTSRWEVIDARQQFGVIYYNTNPPPSQDLFDGMLWLNKLT
jgi:hypothetical protein